MFFFNDTATTEIYTYGHTLSLHDALPISAWLQREMARSRKQKRTVKQLHADLVSLGYDGSYGRVAAFARPWRDEYRRQRSEEHTSELQSLMRTSYAVFCLKKKTSTKVNKKLT